MLLVLLLCIGLVHSSTIKKPKPFNLEDASEHFETFIKEFNKQYENEFEKQMRFDIFKETLKYINDLNNNPNETANFGINQFTDMTSEEISNGFGCAEFPEDFYEAISVEEPVADNLPDSVDYSTYMTPVKNQQKCTSCWAFALTGTIEAYNNIKNGKLISLSEQQLLDCTNANCQNGYDVFQASEYIKRAGGLVSDRDYPYKGVKQRCALNPAKVQVKLAKYNKFSFTNEEAVKSYLVKYGPLAIGVHAEPLLRVTSGGVFQGCKAGKVDHAVVLAGYGKENGIDYWLIRNSWGTAWGNRGYLKIARKSPACNFMRYPGYSPEVA